MRYSARDESMDTGVRRKDGNSRSIRTHWTGFQIPLVTNLGPQSQPKWYIALRDMALVCSAMGLASLLAGTGQGEASKSACPRRTGLSNRTCSVSHRCPRRSIGILQDRCMLSVRNTPLPFTLTSA